MARRRTVILLCIICLGTIIFLKGNISLNYSSGSEPEILLNVNNFIHLKKNKAQFVGQACRVPVLDVNSSEILQLLKNSPKVHCNYTRDWVVVHGSTARITSGARKKYGNIQCSFTEIIRETDLKQYQGLTTTTHSEFNLESSDVYQVHCISEKGPQWRKVVTGIRSDQEILDRTSWSKVPKDSLKLNVLMFGLDSLSHNMWKRKLPKTYKYATDDLKGIALNGYNIVGDGTPQALIPILTGKTEIELPETRKRMLGKAQYVNVYPFLWNDFHKNGYVTAWGEDMVHIGTFTYRLRGFKEQPVDHYLRTFYIQAMPSFEHERRFCYGEISRFKIMINFFENLHEVYKDRPKFAFAFHSEYSHENNDWVSNADEDIFQWLQKFHRKGLLNDTLLILMSDHGSRFASFRNTQQGKQEERLPGFIFVFPSWFEKKYPQAYANFQKNVDRLSTPFDIHETLKNILHYEGTENANPSSRGISLFKEIPLSRTCEDAGIEPHWCTCLVWETLSISSPIVVKTVTHLISFINSLTSKSRHLCAKIELQNILWSAKLIPNEHVLKFKKNQDYDGFVGDMSDNTAISTEIYQVKVACEPGNMIFEASVRYYMKADKFVVSEKDISRINAYRHMTHCIEDANILHHLRKFCYCRHEPEGR